MRKTPATVDVLGFLFMIFIILAIYSIIIFYFSI
jgi:hypothetical protein